jgi:ribosome-associated toxin RatA of RatAB toxin-antitoxin module
MDARTPVERSQLFRNATPREVYEVIVDFEQYPRLFPEIKKVRIIERAIKSMPEPEPEPERVRVEFRADKLLPVRYVLDLTLDAVACTVDWVYVEGEVVTDSSGGWRLRAESDGVRVDYHASAMVKAPLPGFVLRKITDALVSASLPGMFTSLEAEVHRRRGLAGAPTR